MLDRILNRKDQAKARSKVKQARRTVTREQAGPRWEPRFLWPLAAALIMALVIAQLPDEEIMPIDKIRLSGQFNHLDSNAIEQQLKPYLGISFFSVDIRDIQAGLQQQPWIERASVRRVWPDELSVSITEKQAFARWDASHLLSNKGTIFQAEAETFAHLPLINGYQGQSKQLVQRFRDLHQRFKRHGIALSELREDSKGAVKLLLGNGPAVSLGSKNSDQKVEHMLAVYQQQIHHRVEHIRHIDFRYSNGFAIAWKEQYLKQKRESVKRGSKNV